MFCPVASNARPTGTVRQSSHLGEKETNGLNTKFYDQNHYSKWFERQLLVWRASPGEGSLEKDRYW